MTHSFVMTLELEGELENVAMKTVTIRADSNNIGAVIN